MSMIQSSPAASFYIGLKSSLVTGPREGVNCFCFFLLFVPLLPFLVFDLLRLSSMITLYSSSKVKFESLNLPGDSTRIFLCVLSIWFLISYVQETAQGAVYEATTKGPGDQAWRWTQGGEWFFATLFPLSLAHSFSLTHSPIVYAVIQLIFVSSLWLSGMHMRWEGLGLCLVHSCCLSFLHKVCSFAKRVTKHNL